LEAQIRGLEQVLERNSSTPNVEQKVALVSAYLSRAQFLGKIADYDRAEAMANRLVQDSPKDPNMLLVRAAVRGSLHQFKEALADLDVAGKKIKDGRVDVARAVVLQAVGRYDEALALRKEAAKLRETLPSLSALASVHADRGEILEAERLYTEAQY